MWKSIIELNRLRLWLPLELSFLLLSKYIFCESRLRRNMKKKGVERIPLISCMPGVAPWKKILVWRLILPNS